MITCFIFKKWITTYHNPELQEQVIWILGIIPAVSERTNVVIMPWLRLYVLKLLCVYIYIYTYTSQIQGCDLLPFLQGGVRGKWSETTIKPSWKWWFRQLGNQEKQETSLSLFVFLVTDPNLEDCQGPQFLKPLNEVLSIMRTRRGRFC